MSEEARNDNPQWAVLFPWVVQVLGVVVFFLLTRYEVPIPYAAVMFCFGAIMGIGSYWTDASDQLTQSILQWSDIDSSVLLLVFLPGLIFRDAIEVNFQYFLEALSQIMLLAFPVVIFGSFLTAVVGVYLLPYGWSWSLAMTVGAILGSTDPVAVAAVLNQAEAPPRLKMHIGGESLLNDGSAVVLYSIFAQKFFAELNIPGFGSDIGWAEGVEIFFRMSLGGTAVGLAFAAALIALLYELDRRLDRENNVVQVAAAVSMAFLSYYVSEQVCAMSGVLACVVCGIASSALGKGLIADPDLMDSYLTLVEHLLNTLLFTLGGVVWGEAISNSGKRVRFSSTDWGYLFLLYVFVLLIRVVQIGTAYPIMSRIGLKTDWKESAFLIFGGLRGSVGIALALALDRSVRENTVDEGIREITSQVIALAGGVTFLTLLINGSLAGPVLQRLGLAKPTPSRRKVLQYFETGAKNFLIQEYRRKSTEPRFKNAQLKFLQSNLPFFDDVTDDEIWQVRLIDGDDPLSGAGGGAESSSSAGGGPRRGRLPSYDLAPPGRHAPLMGTPSSNAGGAILERRPSRGRMLDRRFSSFQESVLVDVETQVTHMDLLLDSSLLDDESEVLQNVRRVFLELLSEAYGELLARGELDMREDNGLNLDVLKQSVALALDAVNHNQTTADFQFTQTYSNVDGPRWAFRKLLRSRSAKPSNEYATHAYQSLRIQILLCWEFIEAHRIAESRLESYLMDDYYVRSASTAQDEERGAPPPMERVERCVHTVMEESNEQVRLAQGVLEQIPAATVEEISSRYLCSILLHKLSNYVELHLSNGLLKEKEASLLLHRIDRQVNRVHFCRQGLMQAAASALTIVVDGTPKDFSTDREEPSSLEDDHKNDDDANSLDRASHVEIPRPAHRRMVSFASEDEHVLEARASANSRK